MPAPRKALASCKRPKRLPQISESERKEGIYKLKAIKTKHALKALELARKVLSAVKELQALEEVMSEEAARAVHAQYNTVFSEFKLTFDSARLPGQMAISRRKWTTNSLGWRSASKRWRTCAKTHAGCWRTMMHNNNIWVLWETGSVCGNFCGRIRGNFRGNFCGRGYICGK